MTDTHQHAQDTGDGHAHDAGAKGHADTAGDHGHGGGSVPGGGGHLRQPLSMPQESPGIMSSAGLIHDP